MMKILKISMMCMSVSAFALNGFANETKTTTTTTTAAPVTPTQEQAMADAMKAGQPTQGHKNLEPLAGKWNYTVKMWMDPAGKPETMTGTAENQMVLGGRYLEQTARGDAANGMPAFEGKGYTGYDNVKGEYVSTWIDNMSTTIMKGAGTYDAGSKTFTENGTFTCPIKKDTLSYTSKLKVKNNNAYTYETWMDGSNGKQFKSMEIAYTRAK